MMQKGFTCNQPPTDVGISFTLLLSGAKHQQNVTGCVIAGPAGNLAQQINAILVSY